MKPLQFFYVDDHPPLFRQPQGPLPQFFTHNLNDPCRIIKYFANDPQANIRIFYYQYLKLCFEVQNVDFSKYINKIEQIINNEEFRFIFDEQNNQNPQIYNDYQFKTLLMQFFGFLSQEQKDIYETINSYIFIDTVLVYFFRSFLILTGKTDKLYSYIDKVDLLSYLSQQFEVQINFHQNCIKYVQTDIFVYEEKPEEVYMAYMDYRDYEKNQQEDNRLQKIGPNFNQYDINGQEQFNSVFEQVQMIKSQEVLAEPEQIFESQQYLQEQQAQTNQNQNNKKQAWKEVFKNDVLLKQPKGQCDATQVHTSYIASQFVDYTSSPSVNLNHYTKGNLHVSGDYSEEIQKYNNKDREQYAGKEVEVTSMQKNTQLNQSNNIYKNIEIKDILSVNNNPIVYTRYEEIENHIQQGQSIQQEDNSAQKYSENDKLKIMNNKSSNQEPTLNRQGQNYDENRANLQNNYKQVLSEYYNDAYRSKNSNFQGPDELKSNDILPKSNGFNFQYTFKTIKPYNVQQKQSIQTDLISKNIKSNQFDSKNNQVQPNQVSPKINSSAESLKDSERSSESSKVSTFQINVKNQHNQSVIRYPTFNKKSMGQYQMIDIVKQTQQQKAIQNPFSFTYAEQDNYTSKYNPMNGNEKKQPMNNFESYGHCNNNYSSNTFNSQKYQKNLYQQQDQPFSETNRKFEQYKYNKYDNMDDIQINTKYPFGLDVSSQFTNSITMKAMSEPYRNNVRDIREKARNYRNSLSRFLKQ